MIPFTLNYGKAKIIAMEDRLEISVGEDKEDEGEKGNFLRL
jgi:hypothetical protein